MPNGILIKQVLESKLNSISKESKYNFDLNAEFNSWIYILDSSLKTPCKAPYNEPRLLTRLLIKLLTKLLTRLIEKLLVRLPLKIPLRLCTKLLAGRAIRLLPLVQISTAACKVPFKASGKLLNKAMGRDLICFFLFYFWIFLFSVLATTNAAFSR